MARPVTRDIIEFNRLAGELDPESLLLSIRRGLNAVARVIGRRQAQAVAASQPAALQGAASKAVRAKLYRDFTVIRLRLTKSLRKYPGGYTYTGRDSQPWLPLTYWYEHGIDITGRRRRGRDRYARRHRGLASVARSYGSITAWAGKHALQNPAVSDGELSDIIEKELAASIDKTLKKYGL